MEMIAVTVDTTEFRIRITQDTFDWLWEVEIQNTIGNWDEIGWGKSIMRREALSEAIAVIEMN